MPGRADPVSITPAMRTDGSNAANPETRAATDRPCAGGVHDQQHRRIEQPRDVRGGPLGRAPRPSNRPMTPSMTAMSAPAAPWREQRRDQVLAAQHRVQVAARPPGRQRVVAGVDVVGPDLVPGHRQAAGAQRRHQPGGHGGLAVPGRGRGHTSRGHGSPFDAPLALLPGVHRVLDLGHVAPPGRPPRPARGSASRPVITTCWSPGRAARVGDHVAVSTQPHFIG